MAIILSTAYFPPIQYFTKMLDGSICIEQWESFLKQTYRNRCVIDTPNGPLNLTVPVEKTHNGSRLVRDLRISNHGNWKHLHWNALVSSYYNTPFFEYYQDDFRPFYEKDYDFLIDMNEDILMKCLELIDLPIHALTRTTEYRATYDTATDCRATISPKADFREDSTFYPQPYYQMFSHLHGFLPNLSIADLLFNMGPESLLVLQQSLRPQAQ